MNNQMNFLPEPQVKYTQKTNILGEFEVSVHGSMMQSKMQDAFSRLQKRVKLPGFREGKVPLDLVKKKHYEDVLHDVFNQVVSETYRKAAVENKVRVAGDPQITKTNLQEWKEGDSLQYTAQVDLIPEVSVKKYKGLPVTKKAGKIQDEDVEVVLRNLLDPRAELVTLPEGTKVKHGHNVVVDFEGKMDGQAVPDASAKNFMLEVGSTGSIEEFQTGLVGMKAGETKTIDVNYPDDYKNAEVAGKKIVYEVKLHEIKQKNLPELTDEIAKDFQAESAADLRAKVRKSLEDEMEAEQRQQTQEEVLLAFLEANPVEIPPSLVQRQLEFILSDVVNMLRRQKFGDTVVAEYVHKHRKDFEGRAEREVRIALLLPKVVEAEKITVGEADFREHFETIVKQSGQKVDAVEKFYLDNTQRKTELTHELERRKALQVMVDSAKAK
ncbi:MAG TPA: trigger factor [Bdellovibrionota bacterium]|jgi:trigger factor